MQITQVFACIIKMSTINMSLECVEGKILMFPNRIWGSQAETRRWALEIKPKGYQCGVSLRK